MRAPQISCSFSGHRPEKLPWGENERDERCVALKADIRQLVEKAYDDGYRHFICGMARGCDTYFCEEVLRLRDRVQDITVEAAIPCLSQSSGWAADQKVRYQDLLALCNYRTVVQEKYDACCWPCMTEAPAAHTIRLNTRCGSAATCWYCRYRKTDKKEKI